MPKIKKLLHDEFFDVQLGAAAAIVQLDPATAAVTPEISALLHSEEDVLAREKLLQVLDGLGVKANRSCRNWLHYLMMKNSKCGPMPPRSRQPGAESRTAVPKLIAMLRSDYWKLRQNAAQTLGRIGADAIAAVPELIKLLKDDEVDVRLAAVEALAAFCADSKPALAASVPMLYDEEEDVRVRTALALGRIDPRARAAALAEIARLPENKEPKKRRAAALARSLVTDDRQKSVPVSCRGLAGNRI